MNVRGWLMRKRKAKKEPDTAAKETPAAPATAIHDPGTTLEPSKPDNPDIHDPGSTLG